jgi:cytochrome P450 family 110
MKSLPPGPRSALLQMVSLARSKDLLRDVMELARRYGDPMTLPTGAAPLVMVGDPAGVKAIFSADPDTFAPATDHALAPIVGEGSIFMLGGAAHRRARKLLSPPFNGDRMRAYGELMAHTTNRWASRWEVGRVAPVIDTMQDITLDIIIEAIFGVRGAEEVERFHRTVVDTLAAFTMPIAVFSWLRRDLFGVGPWARFQARYNAFRGMIFQEIAASRAGPDGREDVLSLLVRATSGGPSGAGDEEAGALSDQEIFEQLLTMLFAGHETTAVSLAWALYLLHTHPEVLGRLTEELDALGPEPEKLARHPYLEAVCHETLRLYPVLAVVQRKLARPFTLMGYEVPAGHYVGVNSYLAHRREATFPEPDRFLPARFLGKVYSPFEYLPFGGGARRCLGAPFALFEMKIVLGTLLRGYRLELREDGPVTPSLRAATIGPRGGVRMALKERRDRRA